MIGPLTFLDAALIAIASISGLLAMYRGFTREVLSILSWIAAAGAVFYFVFFHKAVANDFAQTIGTKPQLAQIALGGILFLIVLVIVHLITARISDAVLDGPIGMIDRLLGFIFGLTRGFLLVVIPYMFWYGFLYPQNVEKDVWVRESYSRPYIERTSFELNSFLQRVIPDDLNFQRDS